MKVFSVKDNKPIMSGERYLVWLKGEGEPHGAEYSSLYFDSPCWQIDGCHGDFDFDKDVTHYAFMPKRPKRGESKSV